MAELEDEVVNIQQFVDLWSERLNYEDITGIHEVDQDKYILEHLSLDADMVEELNTVCGPETLACPGEPSSISSLMSSVPPDLQLVSTGLQEQELSKRNNFLDYKRSIRKKMKYMHLGRDGPWVHQRLAKEAPQPSDVAVSPQAVLSVLVFKPFFKWKKAFILAEFEVLGCQKLTELRDKIICNADLMPVGECSDNPDSAQDVRARDIFHSGFFFIEGVFYNDMRKPNCQDYSQTIIKWSKSSYTQKKMEETYFVDLNIRLGYPYLYMHQANCEHLMVFLDLRLLHREECQDLTRYPLVLQYSDYRAIKCRVCQMHRAAWVTRSDPLAPEDPCFFCTSCFRSLHYDKAGLKLVDFKAYGMPDLAMELKAMKS